MLARAERVIAELRDYQARALEGLRASLRAGRLRPMLAAPTGAGKTKIAAAIVSNAIERQKRVAFCVPAISLIDQSVRAFYYEGIDRIGVQQGNHPMWAPHAPVQICSIQTLEKRSFPIADVVIIDEAHIMRERVKEWMDECPALPFIGLSATPWAKGLGKWYDDLVVAATTRELIEAGHLSRFVVYAPSRPDLEGVRTVAGEWHKGDLAELARNDRALIGDVVETWHALAEGRPTVLFAVDRAHADILAQQFEASGVSSAYIDCFTPRDEREDIRLRFHSGLVKVVCNVDCLGIGVDWDIRCVVLARPHKSEMAYVQKIGRGLRTAPGKDYCLILDHSSTSERLGFVDDIHRDWLDDGKPRAKSDEPVPKPKRCPECKFMMERARLTCPQCGHEMPVPKLVTSAQTQAGSLGLFDKASRAKATMQDKAEAYGQLLGYARSRGWKDGWAKHSYREMFGVWPSGLGGIAPRRPSRELMNWITARNIRRAKGRKWK